MIHIKQIFLGLRKLLISIIAIILAIKLVSTMYSAEWSGLGASSIKSKTIEKTIDNGKIIDVKEIDSEIFQPPKKLWNWLELTSTLAIPIVIFQLERAENKRAEYKAQIEKERLGEQAENEKEIAANNLREEALQAYTDRISELLIDEVRRSELLLNEAQTGTTTDNPVQDVARIRTVTVLRRLEGDEERQNRILHFLRDSGLLKFVLKNAKLEGANLKNTYLRDATLSSANLSSANLSGANLRDTNLIITDFRGANLSSANLSGANLSGAYLTGADVSDANLRSADLSGAYLGGAKLSGANLGSANLEGADLEGADLNNASLRGCNLSNANLNSADFKCVKNITPEQIKVARNWEYVKYDPDFCKELGLPETVKTEQEEIS